MKKTAAVSLEGSIVEGADPTLFEVGRLRPGIEGRLAALHASYRIIIVSPILNTNRGVRILTAWLYDNNVPFDDLWMGSGMPYADVWVHDEAVKL